MPCASVSTVFMTHKNTYARCVFPCPRCNVDQQATVPLVPSGAGGYQYECTQCKSRIVIQYHICVAYQATAEKDNTDAAI